MKNLMLLSVSAALFLSGCAAAPPSSPNNSAVQNSPVPNKPDADNGLKTIRSQNNFDETYAKLKAAVEKNEQLKIITEIDHAGNAAKADLNLPPTRLLIFGNPQLGTPLMNEAQTLAIDLPQKMLVYETPKGEVFVAFNDPLYLARRHNVSENREELHKAAGALRTLAEIATTK